MVTLNYWVEKSDLERLERLEVLMNRAERKGMRKLAERLYEAYLEQYRYCYRGCNAGDFGSAEEASYYGC